MGESIAAQISYKHTEANKATVREGHRIAGLAKEEGKSADILNPELIAIEQKAKTEQKEAQKVTKLAKEKVAATELAKEEGKNATAAKIAAIKEADTKKLQKDEAKFRAKLAEKIAAEKRQQELTFARQELANKAQAASEALDKAKLDGLKKIEDIKEKAAEKQGKASAQEKRMSDSEVKKIRIAQDLKLSDQASAVAKGKEEKDEKAATALKAKEAMATSAGQKALDAVAEKLKAQQVKAEEGQASLA